MGKWKIIFKNGVKGPVIPPGKTVCRENYC